MMMMQSSGDEIPFSEDVVGDEMSSNLGLKKELELLSLEIDGSGPPEIPFEEIHFDIKDIIGAGSFGTVYRGSCRGKSVAVKVPHNQDLSEEEMITFKTEVTMARKTFFPHIVLFLGACTKVGQLAIITELMTTDLERVLKTRKWKLSPLLERLKMAKEAALGINWLHGICSIIHRDLKPANFLIDSNGSVKVTDFGFASLKKKGHKKRDTSGIKGTVLYMAPEVLCQKPFDFKSDVYSFGLVMWEMFSNSPLFPEYSDWDDFFDAIVNRKARPPLPDKKGTCKIDFPRGFPRGLTTLLRRCWGHNHQERPTCKEVVFRLDEVVVDCLVTEEDGKPGTKECRYFWKKHWLVPRGSLQELVPWEEWLSQWEKSTTVNPSRLDFAQDLLLHKIETEEPDPSEEEESLRESLGSSQRSRAESLGQIRTPFQEDHDYVSLSHFSLVHHGFGNFFSVGKSQTKEQLEEVLQEMEKVISQPWFHGDISKEESEARLNRRPLFTFLVRLSRTAEGYPFTISKWTNESMAFRHKRVKRELDGTLSVPTRNGPVRYPTLSEMIQDQTLQGVYSGPCPKNTLPFNPYDPLSSGS